jgi:hypothetical protein
MFFQPGQQRDQPVVEVAELARFPFRELFHVQSHYQHRVVTINVRAGDCSDTENPHA